MPNGAKGLAGFDPGFLKHLQEPIHVAYQKQRSELELVRPKDYHGAILAGTHKGSLWY